MTAKGSTGMEVLLSTLEVNQESGFNYITANTRQYWRENLHEV